jgi:hypothetical protein
MVGRPVFVELVADDLLAETGVAHRSQRQTRSMKLLERLSGPGHWSRVNGCPPEAHLQIRHGRVEPNPQEVVDQPGQRRPGCLEMNLIPTSSNLLRDPTRPIQHVRQRDMDRSIRGTRQQPVAACPHVDTDFFHQCAAVINEQPLCTHFRPFDQAPRIRPDCADRRPVGAAGITSMLRGAVGCSRLLESPASLALPNHQRQASNGNERTGSCDELRRWMPLRIANERVIRLMIALPPRIVERSSRVQARIHGEEFLRVADRDNPDEKGSEKSESNSKPHSAVGHRRG